MKTENKTKDMERVQINKDVTYIGDKDFEKAMEKVFKENKDAIQRLAKK